MLLVSDENIQYKYKMRIVNLGDLGLEIITLGNHSQVNIGRIANGVLPITFWLDLMSAVEDALNVTVTGLNSIPSDLRRPNFRDLVILTHTVVSLRKNVKNVLDEDNHNPPVCFETSKSKPEPYK